MIKYLKTFLTNPGRVGLTLALIVSFSSCNNSFRVKNSSSEIILITDSLNTKAEIDQYIAPYKDSLEQKMNKVIGFCERRLTKGTPESLLTNFTADLILLHANNYSENNADFPRADIAVINHKGLRTALEKGDIKVKNIFNLMPFENEIILVTLNKSQLVELFDFMAANGGDGLAGASFIISDNKATNIKINNLELEDKNYVVATSDYLANGGDHYVVFNKGELKHNTKLKVRDVIIDHIMQLNSSNTSINSQLDKRISHATK